jgi:hypothetical protein
MRKSLISAAAILLTLVFLSQPALPWGSATHAFIMDHIGKPAYLKNINEIYGSMAPDIFNLMPQSYLRDYLWDKTHRQPGFMKVWHEAKWVGLEKPLAYGFVAHNDQWAMDYTAHHRSRLYWIDGYVIVKAKLLEGIFKLSDLLGITKPEAVDLWHNLVEVAGDIIIWRNDPNIGKKIKASALLRSSEFPQLLIKAYAAELNTKYISELNSLGFSTAQNFLFYMEDQFRQVMLAYGNALDKNSEDEILDAFVSLASLYFDLPGGVGDAEVKQLLEISLLFIQDDYMREINRTKNFTNLELLAHWIFYF